METFDSVAHENRIIGKQHIAKTCSSLRDWYVDFSRNVCVQHQKAKSACLAVNTVSRNQNCYLRKKKTKKKNTIWFDKYCYACYLKKKKPQLCAHWSDTVN